MNEIGEFIGTSGVRWLDVAIRVFVIYLMYHKGFHWLKQARVARNNGGKLPDRRHGDGNHNPHRCDEHGRRLAVVEADIKEEMGSIRADIKEEMGSIRGDMHVLDRRVTWIEAQRNEAQRSLTDSDP